MTPSVQHRCASGSHLSPTYQDQARKERGMLREEFPGMRHVVVAAGIEDKAPANKSWKGFLGDWIKSDQTHPQAGPSLGSRLWQGNCPQVVDANEGN